MNSGKKAGGIILTVLGSFGILFAILFTVIFVFVGGAMGSARDEADKEFEAFKEHAVEVTGTVVSADTGVESSSVGGSSTVISYTELATGNQYEVTFSVSTSSYPTGSTISVYYDEEDPTYCMAPDLLDSTYGMLDTTFSGVGIVVGVIFGIFGVLFLIIGIVLLKKSKTPAA